MSDLDTFESEVRRMLERRAADITDLTDISDLADATDLTDLTDDIGTAGTKAVGRGPTKPPIEVLDWSDRRPHPDRQPHPDRRAMAGAAAAAVIVLLLLGAGLVLGAGDTVSRIATAVAGEDQQRSDSEPGGDGAGPTGPAPSDPKADDGPSDAAGNENVEPADWTHEEALAAALAQLPSDFDPATSPAVFIGVPTDDPAAAAGRYLASQLWLAESTVDSIPAAGDLSVHRWSAASGAGTGFVIVRPGDRAPEVVAATTDAVDVTSAVRTVDWLTITIDGPPSDSGQVQVSVALGEPIENVRLLDGPDRTVAVELGPVPVAVRIIDPDLGAITDFGVHPVAFAESCGVTPPIAITVGAMAGALEDGPIIDGVLPPLTNQQAWHHRSAGPDRADLEIRWPADPLPAAAVDTGTGERSWLIGGDPFGGDGTRFTTLLLVGEPGAGPCSLVQITVDGHSSVAGWWAYALSAEWNFGESLSIAQLDPADLEPVAGGTDLVSGVVEVDELPAIPETGSCDGLPDAPPQSGPGAADTHPDPESALAAFLDGASNGDPPIASFGYTEIVIGGTVSGYAILDDHGVYTVIEVVEAADGWAVTGWSGSAC